MIFTKAALVAVLQLSFRKTILKLHLRVQTTSKQLRISIFAPRIFRSTCMFTDKEDSGREITSVTDKEIQSRNEARIDCLQSAFSLLIRLVLISASAIANHDVM